MAQVSTLRAAPFQVVRDEKHEHVVRQCCEAQRSKEGVDFDVASSRRAGCIELLILLRGWRVKYAGVLRIEGPGDFERRIQCSDNVGEEYRGADVVIRWRDIRHHRIVSRNIHDESRRRLITTGQNEERMYRISNGSHMVVYRCYVSEYAMRVDVMTQSPSENPGDETIRLLLPFLKSYD